MGGIDPGRPSASGETPGATATAGGPPLAAYLFRREGEYWTIQHGGTTCRLRDGTGLRYLARLLARPGEKVPAIELLAGDGRRRDSAAASTPPTPTGIERARVSVTRAIRAALQRCGAHNAALLEHLTAAIRTGTTCSYKPDPRRPRRAPPAGRAERTAGLRHAGHGPVPR